MPRSLPQAPSACAELPCRVLITGGAGFIGAALAHELSSRGAELVLVDDFSSPAARKRTLPARAECLELDVTRLGALAQVFERCGRFDFCVHLAARVGVRVVLADCEGARRANVQGVERLLQAIGALPARERPRVLFASTSEVYGSALTPLAEGAPLRQETAVGRYAYAGSKLRGERLLEAARGLWDDARAPVCVRFFNVVGPGQDASAGMVLPSFLECVRRGEPLCIWGDGEAVRTYAHVDEVARTLGDLMALPRLDGGALNLGGRARASVRELASALERGLGRTLARVHLDPRQSLGAHFEEERWREPDLTRLRSLRVHVPARELDPLVQDSLVRSGMGAHTGPEPAEGACASRAS